MNLIVVAVFEFWKSLERFRMAAYEDWIPLDNDIFNRLDNCDPSFCWELMKNDVIKVRSTFSTLIICSRAPPSLNSSWLIQNLLGEAPIPVPFLDEAYNWEPFSVVSKHQGAMRLAGTLVDCLGTGLSSWIIPFLIEHQWLEQSM